MELLKHLKKNLKRFFPAMCLAAFLSIVVFDQVVEGATFLEMIFIVLLILFGGYFISLFVAVWDQWKKGN